MSITCTKELTLSVLPAPAAYYKCDALVSSGAGEDKLVDAVGGRDLLHGTETFSTIVPGKVGNCILGCNSNGFNNSFVTDVSPFWDLQGTDFTYVMWFKQSPLLTAYGLILGNLDQASFWTHNDPELEIYLDLDTGAFTHTFAIPDDGWHRYVLWYKQNTEIGVKLDNNASIVTPTTYPISTIPDVDRKIYLSAWRAASIFMYFDEIGIWKTALSESQLSFLWNSGAGRTYP